MNALAAGSGEQEIDPRPVVKRPREGLPGAVIAALAVLAALILFAWIEHSRASRAEQDARREASGAITAPPPLALPADQDYLGQPAAPTQQLFPPVVLQRQPVPPRQLPAASAASEQAAPVRRAPPQQVAIPPQYVPPPVQYTPQPRPAPALVIDGGSSRTASAAPAQNAEAAPANAADAAVTSARPRRIASRSMVVPVGTLIPAVLETPIDTARPGMVRAVVSRDTRGFDGSRVLIPRGSRLIGDYQSEVRSGQNRVLVSWNILILPDGSQIDLKSPGADPLGGAGVPGKVHSYFAERFGTALLQTAMNLGTNLALSSATNGSVILAVPGGTGMLGQELFPSDGYKPKITVKNGAVIKVFVARDLDFSEVLAPAR